MSEFAERLRQESKWLQAEATRHGRNGDMRRTEGYLRRAARWLDFADYLDGRVLVDPEYVRGRWFLGGPFEAFPGVIDSHQILLERLQSTIDKRDERVMPE